MPATFWVFDFFLFISNFLRSNLVFFEPKVGTIYMCVCFHSFCATDLNFGTPIKWKNKIINFKNSDFYKLKVVRSSCYRKNIGSEFTHLYNLHCVRSVSWCATNLDTTEHVCKYLSGLRLGKQNWDETTPPIVEIVCVKNARAFVVCRFLMKYDRKRNMLKIWKKL